MFLPSASGSSPSSGSENVVAEVPGGSFFPPLLPASFISRSDLLSFASLPVLAGRACSSCSPSPLLQGLETPSSRSLAHPSHHCSRPPRPLHLPASSFDPTSSSTRPRPLQVESSASLVVVLPSPPEVGFLSWKSPSVDFASEDRGSSSRSGLGSRCVDQAGEQG